MNIKKNKQKSHQTNHIPYVPFYFVRHGQTDWNRDHKVMGQIDIPLNEVGLRQAEIVAENIAHLEISHIVSSPLKRTIQTADIIAKTINRSITVVDELKECFAGIMEGQHKGDGKWLENWKMGGNIEGAESWLSFVSRTVVGLNAALTNTSDAKPILIVAHQPTYWALLRILNTHDAEMNAENCRVYFFNPPDLDSNKWIISVLDLKII